jgi:hypothetical protein
LLVHSICAKVVLVGRVSRELVGRNMLPDSPSLRARSSSRRCKHSCEDVIYLGTRQKGKKKKQ